MRANDSLIPYRRKDLWGYVNSAGDIAIPFSYSRAHPFSGDFAIVHRTSSSQRSMLGDMIDKEANVICENIEVHYSHWTDCLPNLSCDRILLMKNGAYGYLDSKGIEVIPFHFDTASSFVNDVAHVSKGGHSFFIDVHGDPITLPNRCTVELSNPSFQEGLLPVRRDHKYGYVDRQGRFVISPRFSSASAFSGSYAIVSDESHRYGIVDVNGEVVVTMNHHSIRYFDGELFIATNSDLRDGLYNRDGQVVIPPNSAEIVHLGGRRFEVKNDKYQSALYDSSGMARTGFSFLSIKPFRDNRASFMVHDLYKGYKIGFLNEQGETVIKPSFLPPARHHPLDWPYSPAFEFNEGACVVIHQGLYGLIDNQGFEIAPPSYSHIGGMKDGLSLSYKESSGSPQVGYLDKFGNEYWD